MEVTAQCCILPLVLYNVLCMSGQPLSYRQCASTRGALWKLGNKGLGILLEEVYVRVGDWGLLPAPEFPCVACGDCMPEVPTIVNLSTICAKD
jgi:hypothetical protein